MVIPLVTFEESNQKIAGLVAKYEGVPTRTVNKYNEENTKKDFVLPLFHQLGWDVENINEVTAEEKASSGRVDYAFKLGGVSKFYVEVKPLGEDLTDKADWAKQAITYAENKGVTWAILTNFRQLMVFNAEWDKPNLEDARFLNLTYRDYIIDFAKLWWLSKDSVEKGILNEEARKVGRLKPKLPVEKSLYDQLRQWRAELFTQIYRYHKDRGFTPKQTDELIQQFINRLIFIRGAEDRGIEENQLRAALHQWWSSRRQGELIDRIRGVFHRFADLYDSDLFPTLDAWDAIFVQSDTLEEIIQGLYERPTRLAGYDFAAIDADILGAVYEQYLGYVAQVAQEQAKKEAAQARLFGFEEPVFELEAKRLKRKQQGIYYTPKFVVDYIVRETVGRFLRERSHNEIVNIKILDPACGSGSFLIRAYDELLNYHAQQRGKSPAELDQWERLPILTRNIFGVDLDRQAVEIARLNLLLRSLAKRETLPSLADYIREGNSLISGTEEDLRRYFGDTWQEKKPFNWKKEFKDIMANGGFDVAVSNPPYVSFGLRGVEKVDEHLDSYLRDSFPGSAEYKLSTYAVFIDRGIQLLKDGGYLGYIVPDSFLLGRYFSKLRRRILDSCGIKEIVLFAEDFWAGGTVGLPVIIVLQKLADETNRKENKVNVSLCGGLNELESRSFTKRFSYEQYCFASVTHCRFRLFFDESSKDLVQKVEAGTVFAKEVISIHTGVRSKIGQTNIVSKNPKTKTWQRGLVSGSEINRYFMEYAGNYINIDPQLLWSGGWDKKVISQPKLLMRQTGDSLIATLDNNGYYHLNNLHSIIIKNRNYSLKYILGILNSRLMNHYYHLISLEQGRTMAQTDIETIEQLPIRRINFNNPADKKMHDDLVTLVDKMLELNKRLAPIRNTACSEREELLRQIKQTDQEIDNLVYDLYGLTTEERKIVEEATKS